jgi:hypothetical protein
MEVKGVSSWAESKQTPAGTTKQTQSTVNGW